jgi:hypothetical protein
LASIAPPDNRPAAAPTSKYTVVKGGGTPARTEAERRNVLVRVGKSVWGGIKRVNKVVGEAEARLILRVFYYTVFGVVSLVRRRKPTDGNEQAEVAWSPRTSTSTDPNKQY